MTLLSMVLVFCAASFTEATAQETGTVTGQVTDASTGQPLTGVQIAVAGTNIGGLTNTEGRYLINAPAGAQRIRAVLIGYSQETVEVTIPAGGTATANFALETSAVQLEAVVVSAVTGREQRVRELGASVAAIEVEDLNPAPITSFADALGGRTEGVILQDINGTTGTSQRIRIRGANSLSLSNQPLIYIDGVQANASFGGTFGVGGQESSRLNDINPNDIADIEIIKGPAASALYGTAAANGVILITTKRGQPGNTQWTAFVEGGMIDDITDYPTNFGSINVVNPDADRFTSLGTLNTFDADDNPGGYGFFCPNRLAAAGSCTQDETISFNTLMSEPTRPFDTGDRRRYGASVRGGTEDVRYYISGQYEDETGVISMNTQQKANVRTNLDAKLSETVDVAVSFGYAQTSLALNNNDNSIFSPIINGLLGYPNYIEPQPERGVAGSPVNNLNYGFQFNMGQLSFLPSFGDVDRYTTSASTRWRPTNWLSVNASGGLDLTVNHQFETLQPDRLTIAASYEAGYRASERITDYVYTLNLSGVGVFELSRSLLSTTTLGTSYNRDNNESTYCYGSALIPTTASCGTTSNLFEIDEDFSEIRTVGAYVQQELAWRDRVFLAAGLRGDDNSAFGADFGFAYYPSASLSWVIADEEWFPELNFMNTLRLRGAWGVSGLRPGFRDAITLFESTTVATPAGDVPGIELDALGNLELKPERSTEYEFGFDTGLFDDRLSVVFTYFNKRSEDALIERRLAGSLGLTEDRFDNIGSISNSGTELGLNLMVFETQNFGLNLGFNNTTLSNEVEELGEGVEDIIFNRGLQRHREGLPAGAFFLPAVTWNDADGNDLLTRDEIEVADSSTYIGPSLPTWQRSLFADMRVFDWITLSTLIEGRGGNFTGNDSEAFRCGAISSRGCAAVADPTAPLQEQAAYLADRYGDLDGDISAAGYVEKADFYKWREFSVTLSAPNTWAQRFQRLDGLRLTVAGRNLATWTDYDGLDPETVEGGGNANFSQSEFNTQPPVRYLMLRLDYTF